MARLKGGKLTVIYDTTKRQPLDSRMLVTKKADLINPNVWVTSDSTSSASFNGMIVSVNTDGENNGVYYLEDRTKVTAENYSNYQTSLAAGEDTTQYFSMWKKLAASEEAQTISIAVDGGEITE